LKDRVFATISGPNESSDSETKIDLPLRGQNNQGIVETVTGNKTDDDEIGQPQQQKILRTTKKSIPIVLKTDVQKELSSVMDDRPLVPAKNHARPQVQHKLDNRRDLRNQNALDQDRSQDQAASRLSELQEELRKAKEQAFLAEEEVLKGREIQEELKAQLEDLISQHEGQYHDSDKLNQQNLLLSKELSRAHEHLNRDQVYQSLISERRVWEKDEKIFKSRIKLLHQDMLTAQNETKRMIQGLKSELAEARSELQRRLQESDDQVARVQNQRDQVINERDRVRKELDRVVQQLASQTSLDVYHFDDVYFQSQFSVLRGNIKDWAHRAFSNGQFTSDRRINLVATKIFDSISTHWESYMYSDEHRSTIVQAFVWIYLLTKVFGGRFWETSTAAQPFGRLLEKYLEPLGNCISRYPLRLENLQFM
jgi:hypothetical protein